jgi:V8-like Glu-specific endopeptidase
MIDDYPVEFSAPEVKKTLAALSSIYRISDIERIVLDVGLPAGEVTWETRPALIWRSVFETAAGKKKVGRLLETIAELYPALRVTFDEVHSPDPIRPEPEPGDLASRDRAFPSWKNFSENGRAEAVIVAGQPTFVDISFLALGLARARSVCRLVTWFPGGGSGTAFRVGERHLLTNHHVLHDHDDGDRKVISVQAWFNYETDERGALRPIRQIDCDPDSVVGEKAEDWALIQTSVSIPDEFPVLPLTGARLPEVNDRVCIIQHPLGQPKKIALQHNLIRWVDDNSIQYWTDTDFGSSGSPVFDESFEVVALHHFSVPTPHDNRASYRNQGRRIDRVVQRMKELGVYPEADH